MRFVFLLILLSAIGCSRSTGLKAPSPPSAPAATEPTKAPTEPESQEVPVKPNSLVSVREELPEFESEKAELLYFCENTEKYLCIDSSLKLRRLSLPLLDARERLKLHLAIQHPKAALVDFLEGRIEQDQLDQDSELANAFYAYQQRITEEALGTKVYLSLMQSLLRHFLDSMSGAFKGAPINLVKKLQNQLIIDFDPRSQKQWIASCGLDGTRIALWRQSNHGKTAIGLCPGLLALVRTDLNLPGSLVAGLFNQQLGTILYELNPDSHAASLQCLVDEQIPQTELSDWIGSLWTLSASEQVFRDQIKRGRLSQVESLHQLREQMLPFCSEKAGRLGRSRQIRKIFDCPATRDIRPFCQLLTRPKVS